MKPITKLIKNLNEFKGKSLYENDISDIKNVVIDYINEEWDWQLEELLYEFEDYDTVEDYVKHELESWWLERLRYCINDCYLDCDYYRINAYWNLENITSEDIENRVNELIDRAEEIKNEK